MEFIGKIIAVEQPQQGTKQDGQPWVSQTYVAECEGREVDTEYGKAYIQGGKLVFDIFGQNEIMKAGIQQGKTYKIIYRTDARQSQNGRWYGSNKATNVIEIKTAQQQAFTSDPVAPYNAAPGASSQQQAVQTAQQYGFQPVQQEQSPFPPQQNDLPW